MMEIPAPKSNNSETWKFKQLTSFVNFVRQRIEQAQSPIVVTDLEKIIQQSIDEFFNKSEAKKMTLSEAKLLLAQLDQDNDSPFLN